MADHARLIPLYRELPRLARDPLGTFERAAAEQSVVRLNLGPFRPYLVTRPADVQHVLRDNATNYLRDGMMWTPLRRLFGDGLASEGPTWAARRRLVQPLLSGRHVASLVARMWTAITAAVEALPAGEPLDLVTEMTRVIERALVEAFFGGRISPADADRLGHAVATAFTSLGARMLLPFVPERVPLPGDARFRRAVRAVDEVILPHVRDAHRAGGDDLVSVLARSGAGLDVRQIRDDVVAMFAAGSETTAVALSWLWVVLHQHPPVLARLRAEVAGLPADAPPTVADLARLRYTKMVLQEVLRLYPVGWIIPRTVRDDDAIGGAPVRAGATVLLSPYLTHRTGYLWDRPRVFDPDRFGPDSAAAGRHRFAYFPFSNGPHQCLGSHLFTVEAQLVVTAMLRRFDSVQCVPPTVGMRAAVTLRPRGRVTMVLRARPASSR